jgi:hypothetical protein
MIGGSPEAQDVSASELEATPGIEPGYTDLQSAASPLRHVAWFFRSAEIDRSLSKSRSCLRQQAFVKRRAK